MKQDIFNRIKAFGLLRAAILLLNGSFVVFSLFAHLWTPKGDYEHLYTAYQILPIWPWIMILPLVGLTVWPILVSQHLYAKFWNRVVVLVQSIVFASIFFGINAFFMESSDKAPVPSTLAMTGIILFPLTLVIVSALALRKTKQKAPALPKPTKGRPAEYSQNPFTALGRDVWSLRHNAMAFGVLAGITILLITGTGLLKPLLGPNHSHWPIIPVLILYLGLFLLSYIVHGLMLIVAVATANGKRLKLTALLREWKLVLSYLVQQFLMLFFIAGGFLLLVIPGIILAFRYALAPYILIDRKVRPLEAMRYSSQLMKRNSMQIVGVGIIVFTITIVEVILQLISPVVGALVGGVLLVVVTTGSQVYFTKLYRSLEEAKQNGYKGTRAHWLNGVLLVAAVIAAVVVWFFALVWLALSGHGATATYETPCYRVILPSVYKINKPSLCHLHATTRYTVIDYAPIDDNATTIDELIVHQRQLLYPSTRYRTLPGIGETKDTVDGESAMSYSFFDNKANTTVNVTFVHTHRTTVVDGKHIRNYVLFNGIPAETATEFNFGEFTNMSVALDNTIKWPPYGSADYEKEMVAAQSDYDAKNYHGDVEHAKNAAAAADNDAARALAFEWVGLGNMGLSDEPAANTAFEEAASLDPTFTDALNSLANLSYEHGDYDGAIKYSNKVIGLDDTFADAYNMLALCYDAKNNKPEAMKNIQEAIRLDPKNQVYQDNAAQINNTSAQVGNSI